MSVLPQTGTAEAKFGCNVLLYIALVQSLQRSMTEAPNQPCIICHEFYFVARRLHNLFVVSDAGKEIRDGKEYGFIEQLGCNIRRANKIELPPYLAGGDYGTTR